MNTPISQFHQTIRNKVVLVAVAIAIAASFGIVGIPIHNRAMAENISKIPYHSTNLKQLGIPNFEKVKPFRKKYIDKTPKISGTETLFFVYRIGRALVGVYSINGRRYAVVFSRDGKRKGTVTLIDQIGTGRYTKIPGEQKFLAPSWVANR